MNDEWKLKIAKMAYKEIMEVISKYESTGFIHLNWDECITVDDELFLMRDLRD